VCTVYNLRFLHELTIKIFTIYNNSSRSGTRVQMHDDHDLESRQTQNNANRTPTEYKTQKSIYSDFVMPSKTVTTLSTSSRVNSQFTAMRMLQQQQQ